MQKRPFQFSFNGSVRVEFQGGSHRLVPTAGAGHRQHRDPGVWRAGAGAYRALWTLPDRSFTERQSPSRLNISKG
jgi:hypothetical protein